MSDERFAARSESGPSGVLPADTDVMHSDPRADHPAAATPAVGPTTETNEPLFSGDECQGLRSRWEALQAAFVDEPKRSVEQADALVNETVNSLTHGFSDERQKLEQQWHRGQEVSTEELRLVLRRYRSFFERLLSL
jgi:hypothetical protein